MAAAIIAALVGKSVLPTAPAGPGATYDDRVDDLSPDWFISNIGTAATADVGASGTFTNSPQTGVDTLVLDDTAKALGLDGLLPDPSYVLFTTPINGVSQTLDFAIQIDVLGQSKHTVFSGATLTDSVTIEVEIDGRARAFSRVGSTPFPIVSASQVIFQGQVHKISYVRRSNDPSGSQFLYVDGVLVASDPTQRTFGTTQSGNYRLGVWQVSGVNASPFDGLIAKPVGWNRALSALELQTLVRVTDSVAWAEDVDLGSIEPNSSNVVSVKQSGWHGKEPLVAATGGSPTLVTPSVSGDEITLVSGSSEGVESSLTYSFTDALLNSTSAKALLVEVAEGTISATLPALVDAPPVSGTVVYVSPSGNDTTGVGTLASPWRTIAKAIASTPNSTSTTIMLRNGVNRGEVNLNPGSRQILGYRVDIEADIFNAASWPILDGGINMAGVTWELVDAGRQEYRTQQSVTTLGITGTQIGAFAYAGKAAYEIPRWEPLNGWTEPQKGVRLMPYHGTTVNNDWNLACFRHTGALTSELQVTYYYGPGVCVIGDRVHIRLQPVDDSVDAGYTVDEFNGDYNPANHSIFLWSAGRNLFSSLGAGFSMKGVFVRNYDSIRRNVTTNDVSFERCVFWPGHYQDPPISVQDASNFLFRHNVYIAGLQDSHQWSLGKHSPYTNTWGGNMGRLTPLSLGGVCANFQVLDNLILRAFDCVFGDSNPGTTVRVAYNAMEIIDDTTQQNNSTREEVDHNFIVGPLHGMGGDTPPVGNVYYNHHNVVVLARWRPWKPTLMWSWTLATPHSSQNGRWYINDHNTVVFWNPRRESSIRTSNWPHGPNNIRRPASGKVHWTTNNIFVVVNQDPPGSNTCPHRNIMGEFGADREGILDGNIYHKVDIGLSGGFLFASVYHGGDIGTNSANYASLAALKSGKGAASASFYATWGLTSIENAGLEQDPQFAGGAAMFTHSGRGAAPGLYIPNAAALASGAINLTSLGVSGYSYDAWRGAPNPAGDGSDIGPRAV